MHAATANRNHPRRSVHRRALIRLRGTVKQAIVADVGIGGMRVEHVDLAVGDDVKVYIARSRSRTEPMVVLSGVVRWTVGRRAGIEFTRVDQRSMQAVAHLAS